MTTVVGPGTVNVYRFEFDRHERVTAHILVSAGEYRPISRITRTDVEKAVACGAADALDAAVLLDKTVFYRGAVALAKTGVTSQGLATTATTAIAQAARGLSTREHAFAHAFLGWNVETNRSVVRCAAALAAPQPSVPPVTSRRVAIGELP